MWRYGLVFLFPFLYTAVLSAQNILQEDSVWGSVGKDTIPLESGIPESDRKRDFDKYWANPWNSNPPDCRF